MRKSFAIALLGITAIVISACGGRLGQVEKMESKGTAFQQALFSDYIALSKSEYGEGDYTDSDRFADKAAVAAAGDTPAPYDPANWKIPTNRQAVMAGAHSRLVAALTPAAMDKVPGPLSRAQSSFDCWVQEQEENFQPDHIAACQAAFVEAMGEVDAAMKPKVMAKAPAPAPAPVMAPEPKTWTINFGFDSDALPADAAAKTNAAIAYVSKFKRPKITVAAHTDTSGTVEYNDALAERRLENVVNMAVDSGMLPKMVIMRNYGETKPLVSTGDGVRNAANRRVTIEVNGK